MREKFKCITVYFLCCCVVLGSMCNVKYSFASAYFEKSIWDYYEAVNSGDMQALYCTLGSDYLSDAKEIYEDEENKKNHVGIFNIKNVEIIKMEKVHDISKFEISTYSENVGAVYSVVTNMEVFKQNEYFKNGNNIYYFILNLEGKIIGCWNFEEDMGSNKNDTGISLYSLSCDTPISNVTSNPTKIKVKTSKGIEEVNFKKYVRVVTRCEVGYSNWDMNALKACAVAIKNFGIVRVRQHKYPELGYDVKATTDDQLYDPSKPSVPKCTEAVNAIWNVFWVDSKNKLFPGFHARSKATHPYAVKNGGVLSQTKAQELASEKNYSWIEILRFFYDRKKGTAYYNDEVAYGTTFMNVYK